VPAVSSVLNAKLKYNLIYLDVSHSLILPSFSVLVFLP